MKVPHCFTLNVLPVLLIWVMGFTFFFSADGSDRIPPAKPRRSAPKVPLTAIIEGIVYCDLVEKHKVGEDSKDFALFCLDAASDANYLKSLFTNPPPRVEVGTNNLIFEKYVILDKVTGKPAKLFWAKVESLSTNTAEVNAGWYRGPRAAEELHYGLKLIRDKWVIVKCQTRAIS